jgi:hypothetical protein
MSKQFRSGKGELIRVPASFKEMLMVLVRQIDSDSQSTEAVLWLIDMMRMRGVAPKWPENQEQMIEPSVLAADKPPR